MTQMLAAGRWRTSPGCADVGSLAEDLREIEGNVARSRSAKSHGRGPTDCLLQEPLACGLPVDGNVGSAVAIVIGWNGDVAE